MPKINITNIICSILKSTQQVGQFSTHMVGQFSTRIDKQLVKLAKKDKDIDKIKKFLKYVINNKERIVDYRARQKAHCH